MIFSIGYQHLTPAKLDALLRDLDATLVDVRSRPSGRVKKGFSRDDLRGLLGERYEWLGDVLGGLGTGVKPEGLAELQFREKSAKRIVLMCQEHSPGDCHRHHAIAVPLAAFGVDVWHIFEDEVIIASELQASIDEDRDYECYDLANVIADAKAKAGAA